MNAWLWSLIIGGIMGWLSWLWFAKENKNGVWWLIILGFLGAWAGSTWLGTWGVAFNGFQLWQGLIGACIAIALTIWGLRSNEKK